MKRIFLATTVFYLSLTAVADQAKSDALVQTALRAPATAAGTAMIENEKIELLSDFESYVKTNKQNRLNDISRIHKQYSQFLQKKKSL